ncbi:hypothetical protein ACGFNU_01385 [Spirillospora sp. NPDC048911]|uniref:hypothetical protein n=1 Tax=Spirillospora sp. NPDC048911 TaxID=3364527 RepID=UPI00371CDCD7
MSDAVRSVEMVVAVEGELRALIWAMCEEADDPESMFPAMEAIEVLEDTFGAAPVRRYLGERAAGGVAEIARVSGAPCKAVARRLVRGWGPADRRLVPWLIKVLTVKLPGDQGAPADPALCPSVVLAGMVVASVTYLAAEPSKRPF